MTLNELIEHALKEDIGDGDHTSLACIPSSIAGKAELIIKENGILAGIEVAKKIFHTVDASISIQVFFNDGDSIKKGDIAFIVEGKSISLLTAERTVLNFMQRMSGIATYTNKIASLIDDLDTKVIDTRKTTPNNRIIEKMAVKIGGGENHRFGLYDMILIKDNHIDFAGGITKAIKSTHQYLEKHNKNIHIEIEARNLADVKEIISVGGIHRILLDNFSIADVREAVVLIDKRYETEASGGITEKNIREYAECDVDYISMGALTHHINSLDMSLKAVKY